jgi:membrane associated rhomboid family serine protease
MCVLIAATMGASGSIFGILACVFLDLMLNFQIVKNPYRELFKLMLTITITLVIGLLPYIDNFAHIGGFIVGLLAGLVLLPSISFSKWDRCRKLIIRGLALPMLVGLFVYLGTQFYVDTQSSCTWCKYVDCLPVLGWCDEYTV